MPPFPRIRPLQLAALAALAPLLAAACAPLDDGESCEADAGCALAALAAGGRREGGDAGAGARTLGLLDGRVQCHTLSGERVCADDLDGPAFGFHRYGLVLRRSPEGDLLVEPVYSDAPRVCRGQCYFFDSRLELAPGEPFHDGRAELIMDDSPLTLAVRRAASPAPLACPWAQDRAYSRAILGAADETDGGADGEADSGADSAGDAEASADEAAGAAAGDEDTGADGAGDAERAAYEIGDIGGYLRRRMKHLDAWQRADADERWSLGRDPEAPDRVRGSGRPPAGLALRVLGGGPVDVDRLFAGLVLRLEADAGADLPGTGTVALAIIDAGRSWDMALRLRSMLLAPDLDVYDRIRAGAVLVGVLYLDPELSGEPGWTPIVRYDDPYRTEPYLLEGASLLDGPEEAWPSIVAPHGTDTPSEDAFQRAVRASLAALSTRPPSWR